MKPDTYVITIAFADYDQLVTATDYVSVVGRAYATARKDAAYLALNWLRNTTQMTKSTDVPAKWVVVGIYESDLDAEHYNIELAQGFTGDYRTVVAMLEKAEGI